MQLLDELRREHLLIERVTAAFRGFAVRLEQGSHDPVDGAAFVSFFRTFSGEFHHEREERILFPAVARDLLLPTTRGPVAVLERDHRRLDELLGQIEPLVGSATLTDAARAEASVLVFTYTRSLEAHIDAENSVLFPELERRLERAGVRELPTRPATERECAAVARGEALAALYPPADDRESFRGEGCMMCPAYGEDCRGLEREWWNEWEWEEMQEHVASS